MLALIQWESFQCKAWRHTTDIANKSSASTFRLSPPLGFELNGKRQYNNNNFQSYNFFLFVVCLPWVQFRLSQKLCVAERKRMRTKRKIFHIIFTEELFQSRRLRSRKQKFRQCQFALDCAKKIAATVGPFDEAQPSLQSSLLPWTDDASGRRFLDQMNGLFDKWTSDDFTVALMLFLNRFSGSTVDWVKESADATWEKGPIKNAQEFYAMASKCGDCVVKCLQDETCSKCLQTMTKLDTRDQAASYRAIVSYESELLKDFSFCILQKNNVFNCAATIPTIPQVQPIANWRGKPLTVEAARSILVAHLNDEAAPEVSQGLVIACR